MNGSLFNKRDIIVILILLLFAAFVYLYAQNFIFKNSQTAEILYDNTVIETVSLDKDRTFSLDEFPNIVFEIKDGSIAFIQSDCPDKVCVHTGFINKTGQTAVCLPNKIILKLVSDSQDDAPDAVT